MRATEDLNILKSWLQEAKYVQGEQRQLFTCLTPLKKIDWFVKTLLDEINEFDSASIYLAQYVFDPENVFSLFKRAKITHPKKKYSLAYFIDTKSELEKLLTALYSDWSDFTLFIQPKGIIISADHDEFSNFFAVDVKQTNTLQSRLEKNGVVIYDDYEAPSPFDGIYKDE